MAAAPAAGLVAASFKKSLRSETKRDFCMNDRTLRPGDFEAAGTRQQRRWDLNPLGPLIIRFPALNNNDFAIGRDLTEAVTIREVQMMKIAIVRNPRPARSPLTSRCSLATVRCPTQVAHSQRPLSTTAIRPFRPLCGHPRYATLNSRQFPAGVPV